MKTILRYNFQEYLLQGLKKKKKNKVAKIARFIT